MKNRSLFNVRQYGEGHCLEEQLVGPPILCPRQTPEFEDTWEHAYSHTPMLDSGYGTVD